MSPIFDIDIVKRRDALVIVVSGEIDLATAPELDGALARAEASDATTIWIDIERVMFMDATGLGVLVRHATLDENVERLRITPGPAQVQRLFELSGLRSYLPLHCLN
jgi:anti-sigma B factor antagonist